MIVDYGEMVRVFVFFHNIDWVVIGSRILNLEGHKNCIIGSKVTTILMNFFHAADLDLESRSEAAS